MPARLDTGGVLHCAHLHQGPNGNYLKCEKLCAEVDSGAGKCQVGCRYYRDSDRQEGDQLPFVENTPTGRAAPEVEDLWGQDAEDMVIIEGCPTGKNVDQWLLICHDQGLGYERIVETLDPGLSVTSEDVRRRLGILLNRRERILSGARRAGVAVPETEGTDSPSPSRRAVTDARRAARKEAVDLAAEGWPDPVGELGSIFGRNKRGFVAIPSGSADAVYLTLAETYGGGFARNVARAGNGRGGSPLGHSAQEGWGGGRSVGKADADSGG